MRYHSTSTAKDAQHINSSSEAQIQATIRREVAMEASWKKSRRDDSGGSPVCCGQLMGCAQGDPGTDDPWEYIYPAMDFASARSARAANALRTSTRAFYLDRLALAISSRRFERNTYQECARRRNDGERSPLSINIAY